MGLKKCKTLEFLVLHEIWFLKVKGEAESKRDEGFLNRRKVSK